MKASRVAIVVTSTWFTLTGTLGCASSTEAMGPEGGAVVSDDGHFALHIPEGALAADIEVSVEATACKNPRALASCYVAHPIGTAFTRPIKVSYEIDAETLAATDDPDGLTLVVHRGDVWAALPDRKVDEDHTTVEASALYLSVFALYPEPPKFPWGR